MLETIIEASQNFCIHQMRTKAVLHDYISTEKIFISYIDIDTHHKKYRIYIAASTQFMQRVAKIFLEEEKSNNETLIDMTLETANFIVGSAKVIAQEKNNDPYSIDVPHFEKYGIFDFEYDQIKLLLISEDRLVLAIKELD